MKFAILSSGSKGNSAIIETNNTKILIDLGVSRLYVEKKLAELNINAYDIDAILITHTHVDHIQGLKVFLKKYKPKVYVTEDILTRLMEYDLNMDYIIYDNGKAKINDVNVEIIKTSHDAPESIGFIISSNDKSCVYITDTGYINNKYFEQLSNKNMYVLESNHDVEMLMSGSYPHQLKKRILGNKGHLSNEDAGYYLSLFVGNNTKNIILAHLSDDNNTYEKAYDTVKMMLDKRNKKVKNIIIAKQKERTDLIEI